MAKSRGSGSKRRGGAARSMKKTTKKSAAKTTKTSAKKKSTKKVSGKRKLLARGSARVSQARKAAKRMMAQVKNKAQGFGETAGSIASKVTKAAATTAGVVVGTVQAVLPDNNDRSDDGNTSS